MPAVRVEGLNLDFCNPTVRTGRTSYYSDTVYFGSACIAADDRCNTRVEVNQHASENDYETNCNVVVPDECPRHLQAAPSSENQAESKARPESRRCFRHRYKRKCHRKRPDFTNRAALRTNASGAKRTAKNQARDSGQPLTFKISAVNAVMAPVPPPETGDYYASRSTTSDDQHAAVKDDQHAAAKPATGSQLFVAKARAKVAAASIAANAASPGDFWIREDTLAGGHRVAACRHW